VRIVQALRTIADRYQALSPRERALAMTLVATLALFAAQSSFDFAGRGATEETSARARVAEAASAVEALSEPQLQERLSTEVAKIWDSALVDTSLAGAQAQAILAVEQVALQAGLNAAEVVVQDEEQPNEGAVAALDVAVSSDWSWSSVIALVETLEASETAFVLREISLETESEERNLRAVLRAPVLLEAPE
jgi:hypothetical protein